LGETDDRGGFVQSREGGGGADADEVEIDSIDLAYGMGGTFLDAGDAEVEKIKFSRQWLRNFTDSPPSLLGIAQGTGDSMEPVIYDRDIVIFDRAARLEDHVSDKTWVFAFGQIGMIKRLRLMPDGTVKIMSANRTYPDEVTPGEDLHIIGRVVATIRRH
jgi:phage repressor protein C with HTH and peptisase S24 domain